MIASLTHHDQYMKGGSQNTANIHLVFSIINCFQENDTITFLG